MKAPKETKVLTVVFLTVLVQVLVLSLFGMRALRGQVAEAEKTTRELSLRVLERNLVSEIDRRIREEEESAVASLAALPVETPAEDAVLPRVVGNLVGEGKLFKRAFLITRAGAWFDSARTLLEPASGASPRRAGGDDVRLFERIEADLAAGGDPEEALDRVRELLPRADEASRPQGLLVLARTAERVGRPAEAIAAWTRLVREHPLATDDLRHPVVPLGPMAAAHRADLITAAFRAGERPGAEAVDALLDLRRVLLTNRFQLDADRRRWERERLDRLVMDAAAALTLPERARLDSGLGAIDEEEEAFADVHRRFGAALAATARGERPGGRLREGTHLVTAVALAGASGVTGAVALEFDLDRVRTEVLPALLTGLPLPKGVGVAIVDAEGRPVLAAGGPPTGPVLAETRLGEALPFWTPVAYLRDPEMLESRTAPARRLQVWIMVLSVTGILCAGWFVFRTVRRELRVARMKSDFLSNVTHELKTPLTSIRMFVETLMDGRVKDEDERRECLEVISSESERLAGLIQRVLDFARFEGRKKHALDRRSADVGEVVRAAAGVFSRRPDAAGAELKVSVADDLPGARIDPAAIQELLLNLLSNARKYGGERITLTASAGNGAVRLVVEDDGIGIAEKDHSRIFEKFYRADDRLARDVEGSGLGLALVREIARAHGGRVGVESRVGEGSRFTVMLPAEGS